MANSVNRAALLSIFLFLAVFMNSMMSVSAMGSACPELMARTLFCQKAPYLSASACCTSTVVPYMQTGLCVDLDNDKEFCGSCSNSCGEFEQCCKGNCTNVYADASNCGVCGNSCPGGFICAALVNDELTSGGDYSDEVDTGLRVCMPASDPVA